MRQCHYLNLEKEKENIHVTKQLPDDYLCVKFQSRESEKPYFVLVDAPYPDDGIPSSSEQPVQSRV